MLCPYCKKEIENDSVFCEYCGQRVQQINSNQTSQSQATSNQTSQSQTILEKSNTLFGWYKKCFKQYADFKTRAQRKEYWTFTLINLLFVLPLLSDSNIIAHIGLLCLVAIFIPSLAVSVRRLHDINKSGWYILLNLIPIVGSIVLIIWFCQDSNPNSNEWGECPKSVLNK